MKRLEYILAQRTARADGGSRGVVMMRIATLTVALALAVMIITLAVFTGFRRQISSDFRGFASDVVLFDVAALGRSEGAPIAGDESVKRWIAEQKEVESVSEYAAVGCMIKNGDKVVGLQIKGIGTDCDTEWWASHIKQGALPDLEAESRSKQLLISQSTARSLEVEVGDKLELLYLDSGTSPRRDSFRVAGIYSTGMEEMDRSMALADIRDVRRLAGWGDEMIKGYDIMLRRADDAERVARRIDDEIAQLPDDNPLMNTLATTIEERYPVVFDWLKAHTIIAQTILIIMMVVLLFNMAAAMLIMVFDRIGMIGVLKAQGMRNKAIARIFLYRAALLFARGAAWGNAVGLAFIAVQAVWHPIKLDPEGYMLSELPVSIGLGWWALLNIATLAITVAVMVLPSMMVARIKCEESLKYKL